LSKNIQKAKNPTIQSSRRELFGILAATLNNRITIHIPESLLKNIMTLLWLDIVVGKKSCALCSNGIREKLWQSM
jgi:hypothetical protein